MSGRRLRQSLKGGGALFGRGLEEVPKVMDDFQGGGVHPDELNPRFVGLLRQQFPDTSDLTDERQPVAERRERDLQPDHLAHVKGCSNKETTSRSGQVQDRHGIDLLCQQSHAMDGELVSAQHVEPDLAAFLLERALSTDRDNLPLLGRLHIQHIGLFPTVLDFRRAIIGVVESQDRLLGELAVQRNWVTREQLDECLRELELLRQQGQNIQLGQLLVKKHLIGSREFVQLLHLAVRCSRCGARYQLQELGDESLQ